ncbi:MAG: DNA mismatch repair endonuclease MutL [Epulopiscium sp.]|nr:DNA mismatch repair endonuclease MutL [Candidatus Epulonipiscium sp.]
MEAIKLLDNHTINKIAAGEVVDRPASVVKELVENSIDAKSSAITVEIKEGGTTMIRVTDNGIGISSSNVKKAFLRHATSKIETDNDLENVLSLGFRGEALASIAAVSQLELITKTREELTGSRIELHGGEIIANEEVGCPEGTTIVMRNIFYNTPARKKFLNSPASEAAKVSDIVYKLALGHPEISFKYINNNKLVFNTMGNHKLKNCVMNVYGKEIARDAIEIRFKEGDLTLVGILGKPSISRSNRLYENFFINGRYIKSDTIQNAVEDAYKTILTVGKFPVAILHLIVPPESIDVNVHPTKMEVRFKDKDGIYDFVYKSVRRSLSNENLVPEVKFNSRPNLAKKEPKHSQQTIKEPFQIPRKENNIPTASTMVPQAKSKKDHLFIREERAGLQVKEDKRQAEVKDQAKVEAREEKKVYRDYKIIGQFFNTYWLIEIEENIYIIDQHAAHERILYEKLLGEFYNHQPLKQSLLEPIVVNVSPGEKLVIEENLELLNKFGFEVESFGENAYATRTIPVLFNGPASQDIFKEMLDLLMDKDIPSVYESKVNNIAVMACKAAVKAHDKLSDLECKKIIEDLMELENPYTCPHGRPTIISMTKYEIERKFKRT